MKPETSAVVLIGFQNDYFDPEGALFGALDSPEHVRGVLDRTLHLLAALAPTTTRLIATPIIFTDDYHELREPVGILKTIRDLRAFRADTRGASTIAAFDRFKDRIIEVPGKRGLNAFSNTALDEVLRQSSVRDVILAGAVTSICIDSTGRAAFERGYRVTVLGDCTCGRTFAEQQFYCDKVFPLYANVATHVDVTGALTSKSVA